ncbi:phosphoribosylpyrophosphate synthetase [Mucilaginibacter jinjuensis]|uniref:Phosphoribosylpyrophosphate synthetase n=1 Tax=Mucilaginibacter jinjuensis TaxID=1176721 RepID=A0ABY7T0I1_9SPHI|nr:phosphoribosylpyrophosphate synthetase [Mucilaginibacter jinjuensis]WCT09851.1 phosphoribosylpyrophosphate synthetase [Mucilaginibacter jinjuensis]
MAQMTTLSEIINKLKDEGYTEDFNISGDCIACAGDAVRLHPEQFVVDRHFRFEGESNPDDEAVVYAISSIDGKTKGTLVNSYGVYSDQLSDDMVKALKDRKDL